MDKTKKAFKKKLIVILILQSIIFFVAVYVMNVIRECTSAIREIKGTTAEIKDLLPVLDSNESTLGSMFADFGISRVWFVAGEYNNGNIKNEVELRDFIKDYDVESVFITDEDGKVLLSSGGEAHTSLPLTEGNSEIEINGTLWNISLSEDMEHLIYGARMADDLYLTAEVDSDKLADLNEESLSIYTQLLLVGYSNSVNIIVVEDYMPGDGSDEPFTRLSDFNIGRESEGVALYWSERDITKTVIGYEVENGDGFRAIVSKGFFKIVRKCFADAVQLTFFEVFAAILFAVFVYNSVTRKTFEKKEFQSNALLFMMISLICMFMVTWFWQALVSTTDKYRKLEENLFNSAVVQSEYARNTEVVDKWLDEQFLIQCRVAGQYLSHNKERLTRNGLKRLSKRLNVEYIYLLDENGKVIITDSPFDHFRLSSSSDFQHLLDGADSVVQKVMPDEISGEKRQYIGVSIRDENDICDGCVLISVSPRTRDLLTKPMEPEETLPYSVIGTDNRFYYVESETGEILISNDEGSVGMTTESMGFPTVLLTKDTVLPTRDDRQKNIMGSIYIDDNRSLIISTAAAPVINLSVNSFVMVLYAAAYMVICFLAGLKARGSMSFETDKDPGADNEPSETEKTPENEGEFIEDDRGFAGFSSIIKTNEKFLFDYRWSEKEKKTEDMTPIEMTMKHVNVLGWIFCLVFILPVIMENFGIYTELSQTLSYAVNGDWNYGINIFSITLSLFAVVIVILFNKLARRVLYHIARVSDYRGETVCLLIRGSLKYIGAVAVVFFALSRFGINASTLLASAGILTVVVGFGAKDITADILSGFFLLFERVFDVGDFVNIGGKMGIVTEIGLRTTKLVKFADTTIINNSDIRGVINQSGEIHRTTVDINIPIDTDIVEFEKKLDERLPEMLEKVEGLVRVPRYRGVENLSPFAITIRFNLYSIGYMRSRTKRAFLREFKVFLDENNITIPRDYSMPPARKD